MTTKAPAIIHLSHLLIKSFDPLIGPSNPYYYSADGGWRKYGKVTKSHLRRPLLSLRTYWDDLK